MRRNDVRTVGMHDVPGRVHRMKRYVRSESVKVVSEAKRAPCWAPLDHNIWGWSARLGGVWRDQVKPKTAVNVKLYEVLRWWCWVQCSVISCQKSQSHSLLLQERRQELVWSHLEGLLYIRFVIWDLWCMWVSRGKKCVWERFIRWGTKWESEKKKRKTHYRVKWRKEKLLRRQFRTKPWSPRVREAAVKPSGDKIRNPP